MTIRLQYKSSVISIQHSCDIPHLWGGGRCLARSTERLPSAGLGGWSWCSAALPYIKHDNCEQGHVEGKDQVGHRRAVSILSHLRAARPSAPSRGLGGSLDRAWERKRRGTAHQCLEPSCWIIRSKAWPAKPRQRMSSPDRQLFTTGRLQPPYLCTPEAGCRRKCSWRLGVYMRAQDNPRRSGPPTCTWTALEVIWFLGLFHWFLNPHL